MTMQMTTRTLRVDGASLVYDVRLGRDAGQPPLFLIGSPMGAAGFRTLAGHFTDRTVITYDPRGAERSTKVDASAASVPEQHGDDLHRIIEAIGGPVDLFASSGGAVNALALVARHPGDVRTLVAHEPPIGAVLSDSENALAAARAVHETYRQRGWGAGMAHFMAVVSNRDEFPDDFASRPAPDPAAFGMPTEDDGSRGDVMLGQNMISCTHFEPNFDALRASKTRIVVAAGKESEGEMAHRGAIAVAARLGQKPVVFPSDHGGFLGGEYGQTGQPAEFAATLREVLEG